MLILSVKSTNTLKTGKKMINSAVHLNDNALMQTAGSNPEAVFELLLKHGQTEEAADGSRAPSFYAIYQWTSRRKIPDRWRARLIYVLLAEGELEMRDLFRVGSVAKKQTNYART